MTDSVLHVAKENLQTSYREVYARFSKMNPRLSDWEDYAILVWDQFADGCEMLGVDDAKAGAMGPCRVALALGTGDSTSRIFG